MRLLLDAGRFAGMAEPPRLTRVCDIDVERDRGIELPADVGLVRDAAAVVKDPEVDVVVELIGGTTTAYGVIRQALEAGKPVVTANKALLAERGRDLLSFAKGKGLAIGFEASVCGGVPIMRSLRSGLAADRILSLMGIVNGTCNYILTRMYEEGTDYAAALEAAKAAGYAEPDPTLDVEGTDSAHKLVLLAAVAFGRMPDFGSFHVEGISHLDATDIAYAKELDYTVKLLAIAEDSDGRLILRVHPALLREEHPLAAVSGPFNAVFVEGDAVGTTMFYGPGAGSLPTAVAVLSDVLDVCAGTAAAEFQRMSFVDAPPAEVMAFEAVETRYYLRFTVQDRFGVLGAIATVLGRNSVSIDSVVQKEARGKERVPIIMLTHRARERDVRNAIDEVDKSDFVSAPTVLIRVEDREGDA